MFAGDFTLERRRLHLSFRLLARLYQATMPARWRAGPAAALVPVAVGIAADLGIARWMRRTEANGFGWRVVVDAADAAGAGLTDPRPRFSSVYGMTGVPLAVETSFRLGLPRSAAHVAGSASLAAAALRGGGKGVDVKGFRWPAAAAVLAAGLRRYAVRHAELKQRDHLQLLVADEQYAYLVGQSRVVAGTDTVADWLGNRAFDLPVDSPLRREIHELRSVRDELAVTQMQSGQLILLATAFTRWQQRRRQAGEGGIDLRNLVEVRCGVEEGLVALFGDQVELLEAELEHVVRSVTSGTTVEVRVTEPAASRALGSPLRLSLNGSAVTIPATRDRQRRRTYDPSAIAFGIEALQPLASLASVQAPLPRAVALIVGGGILAAGSLVHFRPEDRRMSPGSQVWLALGVQAVRSIVETRTMARPVKSDGLQLYPAAGALQLPALLLSVRWDQLTRRGRLQAMALSALIAGVGFRLRPRPRHFSHFLTDALLWAPMGVSPARTVRASIVDQDRRMGERFEDERREARRRAEISGMQDWVDKATRLYEETSAALPAQSQPERDIREFARAQLAGMQAVIAAAEAIVSTAPTGVHSSRGRRRLTARYTAESLEEAFSKAAGLGRKVVLDLDNTLVHYEAGIDERNEKVEAAVDLAERMRAFDVLYVVTNSRSRIRLPDRELRTQVSAINRARKPLVWVRPLADHRGDLWGATVIGDQLMTDGMLAHYLRGSFIELRLLPPDSDEPWWPRTLRRAGTGLSQRSFIAATRG